MALAVIPDDVEKESARILSCSNAFAVLELTPNNYTVEKAISRHEEKTNMLKKHFKNRNAVLARARLDDAKMKLLDTQLWNKEKEIHQRAELEKRTMFANIEHLEVRTRMLEERALALQQRQRPTS